MAKTVRVRALVNLPHWIDVDGKRMVRGAESDVVVGDGEGEIPESEFDGKLELGMAAIVTAAKPKAKPAADEGEKSD